MFSIIAAYDETQALGKDNQLLWHIPEDLAFFKETTINQTIVMGRKTFESIGRPLPKRKTIVLSNNEALQIEGVEVCSFATVLEQYMNVNDEVFICGGAEIYMLFLPYVQKLYISKIAGVHEADTYFPKWDERAFECVQSRVLSSDATMYQYERKL